MGDLVWRYRDIKERARGGPIPAWLVYALAIVAVADFVSFVVIAEYLGGDAIMGHQKAGHYFLGYHSRLTEVSRTVFEYSLWHALSVCVICPLAMLTGWLAFTKRQSP